MKREISSDEGIFMIECYCRALQVSILSVTNMDRDHAEVIAAELLHKVVLSVIGNRDPLDTTDAPIIGQAVFARCNAILEYGAKRVGSQTDSDDLIHYALTLGMEEEDG